MTTPRMFYWIALKAENATGPTYDLIGPYNTPDGRNKVIFDRDDIWKTAGIKKVEFETEGRKKSEAMTLARQMLDSQGVPPSISTPTASVPSFTPAEEEPVTSQPIETHYTPPQPQIPAEAPVKPEHEVDHQAELAETSREFQMDKTVSDIPHDQRAGVMDTAEVENIYGATPSMEREEQANTKSFSGEVGLMDAATEEHEKVHAGLEKDAGKPAEESSSQDADAESRTVERNF